MRLQQPLYHGTSCTLVDDILREGLSKECDPVHRESTYYPENRAWRCGVYLTKRVDGAIGYAYDTTKIHADYVDIDDDLDLIPGVPDDVCVIKVKCLAKNAKLGSDGFGDLMTNKDIPPKCLEVLRPQDLERMFPEEWQMIWESNEEVRREWEEEED